MQLLEGQFRVVNYTSGVVFVDDDIELAGAEPRGLTKGKRKTEKEKGT